MSLARKIAVSLDLIRQALQASTRPALMWSGGKDSMVLLHLLRTVRPGGVPVIHLRDGGTGAIWDFADRVMAAWQLDVRDFLPAWRALKQRGERIETVAGYDTGDLKLMLLPRNLYEGDRPGCGVHWLQAPVARAEATWDLWLHGHKSSDVDEYEGRVPLKRDWVQTAGPLLVFPLRDWTDAHVWEYSRRYDVPQDPRYLLPADPRRNNDWRNLCVRCLDLNAPARVTCPQSGQPVANQSRSVARAETLPLPDYIGKE